MEGGVGGAPACLQLVSSSSTTQRVPRGHRYCSPDPPHRCLQLLGLLETIFLTLGITLTEGATNTVPPCIFGVPVQVSLRALSIIVFLNILTGGARKE